jgi:hypothetical protein
MCRIAQAFVSHATLFTDIDYLHFVLCLTSKHSNGVFSDYLVVAYVISFP